jgi:hypothetical protein
VTITESTTDTGPRRDTNGHSPDHPDYNPYDNQNTELTAATETERIKRARLRRWGASRFALVELQDRSDPWAQKVADAVARKTAVADPIAHMPKLLATGADVVNAGATDAELAGLHALTPAEIANLQLESAARREDRRAQVRMLARKIAAERETTVAAPEPCSLDALLDEPDEGPSYRVDGLWPAGGRVLLAAQYKAGKSTLVGNAIRSFVDGDPLLDVFPVRRTGHVALIDTELDRRTLRRWLRDQGIRNGACVTVVPLRGAVSTFDITDPQTRSQWARRLAGADVVILDCLRPVLDALGLSEDKDAGKVLVAFDALLAEIGATEGMIVTHMGHQNERARGDSRLLDWPDALWKIVRDGDAADDNGRRSYFAAHGRDVDVPEGLLTFDGDTRHLSFGGGGRRESDGRAALPALLALVTATPEGLSKRAAEKRLTDDPAVTQRAARTAISTALREGELTFTAGPNRAQILRLPACPTQPSSPFSGALGGLK